MAGGPSKAEVTGGEVTEEVGANFSQTWRLVLTQATCPSNRLDTCGTHMPVSLNPYKVINKLPSPGPK